MSAKSRYRPVVTIFGFSLSARCYPSATGRFRAIANIAAVVKPRIIKALTLNFPSVLDSSKVGEYPAEARAGGGFVWDAVLEYRVWCHPESGAPDETDGSDYYYAFKSYEEAEAFSIAHRGTEPPLALVLQGEYIEEPEPGQYVHIREQRITEWPVLFLSRPQRDARTISDFLAKDAPANRLDILRGLAPRPT